MAKYRAVTSVYETVKKTQHVRRPGTVIDLPDEDAERLLELGAIEPDTDEEPDADVEEPEAVELPERPSNGATKEAWRTYLAALNTATKGELGDLQVPDDATRDQLIAIGDARVAEWEEG